MTDFVGKQVRVIGTSRPDINGSYGTATEYLEEKGRVAIKLENGKSISFKPDNLEVDEEKEVVLLDKNENPMEIHSIEQQVGFRARPELMFQALTDKTMLSKYTQTECRSEPKTGGRYQHFGGNIYGKYLEVEENKKLVMSWRNKDWTKGYYSKVTITLEATSPSVVVLTLTHEGIPDTDSFGNSNQKETVEKGWENFFWERIQKMVGYHKVDKKEW